MEIAEFHNEGEEDPGGLKLVVYRDGQVVEEHPGVTTSRGKTNVATVVNAASQTVKLEPISGKSAEELHAGMQVALAEPAAVAVATAPARLSRRRLHRRRRRAHRRFGGLEAVDEITMVCVPDLMTAYQQGAIDLETVQAVQLAMIAHCELMGDRMAILDPPPGTERAADQGVAGRQGRLRLQVRRAVLAVDQGVDPASDEHSVPPSATWPASGAATTTPAACTRRRPTRSCAAPSTWRRRSPARSTTC